MTPPPAPAARAEIELKFLVPAATKAALVAELAGRGTPRRVVLVASYFDTPDLRLARAGLAWRLRREGGCWVQALKAARPGAMERFEHEVVRPDATLDPAAHADTGPGRELARLLHGAEDPGERFKTRVRRLARRVRTRGAVVDIALDEGRLTAGDAVQPIREVEFELVSGSPAAMLALVERWRHRFGLVHDPRNKAERGLCLAAGEPHPPLRKARPPAYDRHATPREAFGAVLDECLAHLARNGIGLAVGDAGRQAGHVHQLRVAIRRLRSAVRVFRGWVPAPPAELVDRLRALFDVLGQARDREVLGSGVAAELAAAGAPPLAVPAEAPLPDLPALFRGGDTQRLLLDWLRWRTDLGTDAGTTDDAADGAAGDNAAPPTLKRLARRRLRRWHQQLLHGSQAFDTLDDTALHTLRKHAKRQRYALAFFAPLLPTQRTARHLRALAGAQQALGDINDLVVARERYRALVASDPAAWFALGWLAARLAPARARAREAMAHLAAVKSLPR